MTKWTVRNAVRGRVAVDAGATRSAVAAFGGRSASGTVEQDLSHLGQLASEYRFTDIDGSQPDIWRYMEDRACGIDAHLEAYR